MGCGIMLILMVIFVGVGYMLKDRVRDYFADQAFESMERSLDEADLDQDEKRDVLAEIDRLRRGIRANEVSFEEFGNMMEASLESPLMALFLTRKCSKWIRQDPNFSDDERTEADSILDRYLRGRLEGAFTHLDDRELGRLIGEDYETEGDEAGEGRRERGVKGTINNSDEPATKDLRALVGLALTKVQGANIPEDEYLPDISGIIRDLVDPILK